MQKFTGSLLGLVLGISSALSVMAADYDMVTLNGRVMDPETSLDAVMKVGVKYGRSAVITEDEITGKESINAEGLVVAPGFIDTHFHVMDGLGMKIPARDDAHGWSFTRPSFSS